MDMGIDMDAWTPVMEMESGHGYKSEHIQKMDTGTGHGHEHWT
jgi:hypothetical protein